MRRKKLPKIEIRTVPNGYSMAIEGHRQEYMYYTPEALLKGVMMHVGLKMTEELTKDNIEAFIKSSIQLDSLKLCNKEIAKLKREVYDANKNHRSIAKRLVDERARTLQIVELARNCAIGKHSLTDALAKLHAFVRKVGPLKRLKLSDLGIKSYDITDDDYETEEDTE